MAKGENGKWNKAAKEKFLKKLSKTGNVSEAARSVDASRQGAYQLRARDPAFAEAWDSALEEAADLLELVAFNRAVEGEVTPVYFQGKCVGEVRKYSNTLLMTLLSAIRPEKYGKRAAADSAGSPPDLAERLARALAQEQDEED